ncbi:MAG: hypothetical protein O3B24_09470 [Verrucomicrobia bacterium]|nr:hypothetical protein [Verrucomicrobiota bacterium]
MGDGKHAGGRESSGKTVRRAILFELEHVGVAGRQEKFDALKAALKGLRIELNDTNFSRYCLRRSAKEAVRVLLTALGKEASIREVLERYQSGIASAFANESLKADALFDAVVKAARKHNARLGVLSSLDSATTEIVSKRLGLPALGAIVCTISANDQRAYSGDHWAHVARRVETPARHCVTICTQSDSCRAALAARMRTVVRTDRFTHFQDFSGADVVADVVSAAALDGLIAASDDA